MHVICNLTRPDLKRDRLTASAGHFKLLAAFSEVTALFVYDLWPCGDWRRGVLERSGRCILSHTIQSRFAKCRGCMHASRVLLHRSPWTRVGADASAWILLFSRVGPRSWACWWMTWLTAVCLLNGSSEISHYMTVFLPGFWKWSVLTIPKVQCTQPHDHVPWSCATSPKDC